MRTPTQKEMLNPQMIDAVETYLKARAYAEVMREKTDALAAQLLNEKPLYTEEGERILNDGEVYMASREDMLAYCEELEQRQIDAGIKPADMEKGKCPALVGERLQMEAGRVIIDLCEKLFGIKDLRQQLICSGMENYNKWLGLTVDMVVSSGKVKAHV